MQKKTITNIKKEEKIIADNSELNTDLNRFVSEFVVFYKIPDAVSILYALEVIGPVVTVRRLERSRLHSGGIVREKYA